MSRSCARGSYSSTASALIRFRSSGAKWLRRALSSISEMRSRALKVSSRDLASFNAASMLAAYCASSRPRRWVRSRPAIRRVSGVRRSWAMSSHTPLTSLIKRSSSSSMPLTTVARRSMSSLLPRTGRRPVRSPSIMPLIERLTLSSRRCAEYPSTTAPNRPTTSNSTPPDTSARISSSSNSRMSWISWATSRVLPSARRWTIKRTGRWCPLAFFQRNSWGLS